MALKLYDEALVNKLKNWLNVDEITITSPNETKRLFEYKADVTNDQPIKLPLIALRRDPNLSVLSTTKKPLTFDGWRKENTGSKTSQLNAIPVSLSYKIDIYTRYFEEADEYVRNFIFNIINYPKLKIRIPYNNMNMDHYSNIRLESEVQDNSDISERLIPGQFTRFTLSIYIDDAYLFDYKTKDNVVLSDTNVEIHLATKVELDENIN